MSHTGQREQGQGGPGRTRATARLGAPGSALTALGLGRHMGGNP